MPDIERYDPPALYDDIAVAYDDAAEFWDFSARRAISLAAPARGQAVLDVACGPGVTTLRAASMVAPDGWAVGVDASREMLAIAGQKADVHRVPNVSFLPADLHCLPFRPATFDRVLCLWAIFFATDITDVSRQLWEIVRPGGSLTISTFGTAFFAPLFDMYLSAAADHIDPEPFLPGRRTEAVSDLAAILSDAGIPGADITCESSTILLPNLDEWWRIVAATGIHRIDMELQKLDPSIATEVHDQVTRAANDLGILNVKLDVNYAVAWRPGSDDAGTGDSSESV